MIGGGCSGGTLYWVLVKSMCQARLEPELMFGCSLWPSEIDRREDRSSSDALVHLMCLKAQWAVTLSLHVGIKPCQRIIVSKSYWRPTEEVHSHRNNEYRRTILHRENNRQHLYDLGNQLGD